MASKSKLDDTLSTDELACVYAALILADDDVPITAEKIITILNAANITVESIWPSMFAKALAGVDIKQMITNIGNIAIAGGGATTTSQTVAAADEKQEEKKPEAPPEEEEDSDEDFGLSLFD